MIKLLKVCATLCALALPSLAGAATYYVATDGDNGDAGTATYTAWATIDKAASTAAAGDTVRIMPGTYPEKVVVDNSGNTTDGYITFEAYDPANKPWIDATGLMGGAWEKAFSISKKDYIVVDGIGISGCSQGIAFMAEACNYVTVADCEVASCTGYGGITAQSHSDGTASTNITFQRNYVRDILTIPYEAMWIRNDVEYFWILDNIITRFNNIGIDACGQHTLFTKSPRKGVIRGNHVSDGTAAVGSGARGIYLDGPSEMLVEGNTVTACEMGIGASTEAAGDTINAVIIRKNITYLNRSGNIQVGATTASKGTASQIAVYNCDSIGVTPGAWAPGFKTGYLSGLAIIKNCVSYLFATSSLYHVYMTQGGYGDSLTANCNTFYPDGNRISDKYGNRTTLATHKAFWSVAGQDANSINTEPMLTNTHTASYDFTPLEGSPLIDTGTWLATVAGGNTGTTFSVDKAWPFYAGYGSNEAGDWIKVGTNMVQQITAVDPISNSITVRSSIAVADGDRVWYNFIGTAPDIGYEDAGTPTVTPTPTNTPTPTPTFTPTPTVTPTPSVRRFQHRQRRWPKWIKLPGKGDIRV